jgi:hypothetical protein
MMLFGGPAAAQGPVIAVRLDSGAVVRLTWAGRGAVRATLLAPVGPRTDTVVYCRYPSPRCGGTSVNPVRSEPAAGLERIEVRRRGRVGRRALVGGGVGVLAGGLVLGMAESLGERRLSAGRQVVLMGVSMVSVSAIGALLDLGSDRWVVEGGSP